MPITVPHQSIVKVLRQSGVTGVVWGTGLGATTGSPYYEPLPVPIPVNPFPYVTFSMAPSKPGHTFDTAVKSYNEEITFRINVVALEATVMTLGSPWSGDSVSGVFAYLDALQEQPSMLDGSTFTCGGWRRDNWVLTGEATHAGPSGAWVWEAIAEYTMLINAQYPQL